MSEHELLFHEGNLTDTLDNLAAKAVQTLRMLDAARLDAQNEHELFADLKHRFVVNPLKLHRDRMTREGPREVQIELCGQQAFLYGEDRVVVPGMEVTFIVPFDGDPALFQCRPSHLTATFPTGEISGQTYRLTLRDLEKNAERVKQNRDYQLQQVEQYIRWQENDIKAYNVRIMGAMKNAVVQRRKELQENEAFANAFGVPEQSPPALAASAPSSKKKPQTKKQPKAPKVFICHANKDAAKAKDLFDALRSAGADPWLDTEKLVQGDEWEYEIKTAVAGADAFVTCLSPGFHQIGFRQKEVRWALEALELRPPGKGFIIPLIIEPCELPEWSRRFHAGDLSKPTTISQLIRAVEKHCNWTRRK